MIRKSFRPEEVTQIDPRYRKQIPDKLKNVDILSFDGGGSRGIMEISILSDVMRLATIIWRDPEKLSYLVGDDDVSEDHKIRQQLIKDLSAVSSPLHPNEIYDMIVGTSTGALIAFGLVGGKSDGDPHIRLPMTLEECIDMYKEKTKEIFRKSWSHWFLSAVPGLGSIPITTYSQDNVKEVLQNLFSDSCLGHFRDCKTIAGAVARQVGQNEELVLFDTKSDAYKLYKTYQVLQASSDAPVYFETPVKIGDKEFVDGGVGGNCPLAQAIPRAKEIFGDKAKVTSALSIAPPPSEESHIPNSLQVKYWLNYFVEMSTNGHAVYLDVRRRKKNTSFRRLSPRGESLKHFKLDETDAEKMLEAMEDEKLNNEMFLVDIIATAAVVVNTYLDKTTDPPNPIDVTIEIGAKLASKAGDIYKSQKEYELAYSSYSTSKKLWMKLTNPNENTQAAIVKIHDEIAALLAMLGRYPEAIDFYRKNVEHWISLSNDANVADASFRLAECLLLNSCHNEAQEQFQLVLELQRQMFGETTPNPEIARTLNRIGWCYREQGNYDMAVKSYQESLDMRMMLYKKKDHLDVAETLSSLGMTFSELGEHDKAVKCAGCSLAMRQRLIGEEKSDSLIAESLNDLGWCLMGKEEYEKAQENLENALIMMKEYYGDVDHPSIAMTLENKAKCLVNVGKDKSGLALEYAQQALQMKKKCLGDNHSSIAKTLEIVSLCLEKAGNLKEATDYLKDSLDVTEFTLTSTHPRVIRILSCLGQLLVAQNEYHDARYYFTKAMNIEIKRDLDSESQSSLKYLIDMCAKHLENNEKN